MKTLLPLVMVLVLTACGSSKKAPDLYALRATDPIVGSCKKATSIKIHEPVAGPGLDSARIAVMQEGGKQTFYNGVRWSAPATRMVQHYLADTFERAPIFSTVTTDDSTTRSQWILESQLRAFHVDQSGEGKQVVIRLTASLIDAQSHEPVITMPLQVTRDATGKDMVGIAALFDSEMASISQQMLQQVRSKLPGCR